MPQQDFIIDYSRYHRTKALARARVYRGPRGRDVWVIQSEGPGLEDYHGLSVTNGIEKIIVALYDRHDRFEDFAFVIEHYPGKRHDDPCDKGRRLDGYESFSQVLFARWEHRPFCSHTAKRASKPDMDSPITCRSRGALWRTNR